MKALEIHANQLTSRMTMRVRLIGTRQMRARFWVGCQLIRAAAYIMGVGVSFDGVSIEQ